MSRARPTLQEMAPSAAPVVTVPREYTFASGDLTKVDSIGRGANHPVAHISGFGANPGQTIIDWSSAARLGIAVCISSGMSRASQLKQPQGQWGRHAKFHD